MSKSKFYTTKQLYKAKENYMFVIGERSYGKSYALKSKDLEDTKRVKENE